MWVFLHPEGAKFIYESNRGRLSEDKARYTRKHTPLTGPGACAQRQGKVAGLARESRHAFGLPLLSPPPGRSEPLIGHLVPGQGRGLADWHKVPGQPIWKAE